MNLKLFLLLISAIFSRAWALNSSSSSSSMNSLHPQLSTMRSFCKTTPYPDVCFDSLKLSISINIGPDILNFLLHTLQTAITESEKLSNLFLTAGQSNIVEKQRGTIKDCRELHQTTLSSLRRSVSRINSSSQRKLADASAYLSAALTNKNTCLEGLDTASGSLKPILVNSITNTYKHVSNSLSVVSRQRVKKDSNNRRLTGVPTWLSRKDSRILESPDGDEYDPGQVLTVAADGTGNFTTITDAINFAPNNSYDDRIIIYVKEGTYEENVEIPIYKPNIVLLGGGSDVTLITGDRSVAGGWTTFGSATLGTVKFKFPFI